MQSSYKSDNGEFHEGARFSNVMVLIEVSCFTMHRESVKLKTLRPQRSIELAFASVLFEDFTSVETRRRGLEPDHPSRAVIQA